MDELPDTQFARVDGLRLAYQRFGSGVPVVMVPGLVSNTDLIWEHEYYRRMFDHIGRYCDWIHFDKRGMGLSDRFEDPPTAEERIRDIVAVMDHAGWERASIAGISEGGAMARHFAAAHPQRVDKVVLFSTMVDNASLGRAEELSGDMWVDTAELIDFWTGVARTWGEDATLFASRFVPTQVDNEPFVRWLNRLNRLSATHHAFGKQLASIPELLACIPDIPSDIPTLIVHGEGDQLIPVGHGRALAEATPHATYLEVPGEDHFIASLDNWRDFIDPAVAFLAGVRPSAKTERRFATVLFTDIVDSTSRAAELGDDRWSELIDSHDRLCHRAAGDHGGRVVKSTGDGVLATFDVPSQAVAAAQHLAAELGGLGLAIRAGLHAGEIELHADRDISGLAVNLAARIEAHASSGQVLVSSTVRDMLLGSGQGFEDRGEHSLKGIDGRWRLFAAV